MPRRNGEIESRQLTHDDARNIAWGHKDDNYIRVNKLAIQKIGIFAAIYLEDMISKDKYWREKKGVDYDHWFYNTYDNCKETTGMPEYSQKEAKKILLEAGILLEKSEGLPRRTYFKISYYKYIDLFTFSAQSRENAALDPPKSRPRDENIVNDNTYLRTSKYQSTADAVPCTSEVSGRPKRSPEPEVKRHPIVDYWNTLPNTRHHDNPATKTYSRSIGLIGQLKAGTFYAKHRDSFNQDWMRQQDIKDHNINRKFTEDEIKQGLELINLALEDGFETRNKTFIHRSLADSIFSTRYFDSLFIQFLVHPPRTAYHNTEQALRKRAKLELIDTDVALLLRSVNHVRFGGGSSLRMNADSTKPGEYFTLMKVVNELVRKRISAQYYADYIVQKYEPSEHREKADASWVRVGSPCWVEFIRTEESGRGRSDVRQLQATA